MPLLPLHVSTVGIWLLFVVTQPALIVSGRVQQHRRNGIVGAVIALGVVITGTSVQIESIAALAPFAVEANVAPAPLMRFISLTIFAFAVWAAFIYRSRSDWHKRLMLLGTFALLEAPLIRIYENAFASGERAVVIAAFTHTALMLGFLLWDRIANGRFHPATLWGTIFITLILLAAAPLASSDWWASVASRLAA